MRSVDVLKADVCAAIDRRRDEIIELGEMVWNMPETGFRETRTGHLLAAKLQALGLPCRTGLALTGSRADLDTGKAGPTLALLGELDALLLPSHPDADPETGAVHACGHNAQLAGLIGAAIGLLDSDAGACMSGKIAFITVPAEEFIEIDYRMGLVSAGRIRYCGGKAEMIRLGIFDDVDVAMLLHAGSGHNIAESYNGFVMKKVTFLGKAAHSGQCPEKGVNALYAANLALAAVNAQRDTFRDEDSVRIHGIITGGGNAVNIVPDEVALEIQVRARNIAAVRDASMKVDRAARAGALALGAGVRIETLPGYMPMLNYPRLADIHVANVSRLHPAATVDRQSHRGSSTDMGDLSQIMPSLHPSGVGCSGSPHTSDFRIVDPEQAYVDAAKILAMNAVDLLHADAALGREAAALETPMRKAQYLEQMEALFATTVADPE